MSLLLLLKNPPAAGGTVSPPTFVTSYASVFTDTTTPKTSTAFAVQAGDLITVAAISAFQSGATTPTATGGSITWTLRQDVNTANFDGVWIWTGAVGATAASITVSVADPGGDAYGFALGLWRNHGGVGTSAKATSATGTPSVNLTTSANSGIFAANGDFNAITGAPAYRTVNGNAATQIVAFALGTSHSGQVWRHSDSGTAGTYAVGTTAPAGQAWAIAALEVLGVVTSQDFTGTISVSGSGALTFGANVAGLLGIASPSGAGTVSFSGTVAGALGATALSGAGTDVAVGSPGFADARALSGSGTDAIAGLPQFAFNLPLSGAGTVVAVRPSMDATGSGSLTFSAITPAITPAIPRALSGSGTLSFSAVTVSVTGSVSLAGAGTLGLAVVPTPIQSLARTGAGTLALAPLVAFTDNRALSGPGSLTFAPGTTGALGSTTLAGSGSLVFSGTALAFAVDRALSGAGSLNYSGVSITTAGAIAFSGAGSLSYSIVAGVQRVIARSGDGTLTVVGDDIFAGNLSTTGSGSLTLAAVPALARPLALAGTGTLTLFKASTDVALSGSGTMARSGLPAFAGPLAVSGAGTLSTSGVVTKLDTLSTSGTGTLTLSAKPAFPVDLALTGDSSLSISPKVSFTDTLPLSGDGALDLFGEIPTVAFSGSISRTGAGTQTRAGLVSKTPTQNLTDDFTVDSTATKWPDSYGSYVVTGGSAAVTGVGANATSEFSGISTAGAGYTLVNNYTLVKMTVANSANVNAYSGMYLFSSTAGNQIALQWNAGTLRFGVQVNYAYSGTPGSMALAQNSTIWIAVAEGNGANRFGGSGVAGTMYFFTSTDGKVWTQRHSMAAPAYANSVGVNLATDYGSVPSGTSVTTRFDNYNVPIPGDDLDRTGSGTLSIVGEMQEPSGTRAGTGSGTLTRLQTSVSVKSSPAFAGTGQLTYSRTVAVTGSVSLSGAGSLQFAAIDLGPTLRATGAGSLTLAVVPTPKQTLQLSGPGDLDSHVDDVDFLADKALSGTGTLALGRKPSFDVDLNRTGDGLLAIAGKFGMKDELELTGNGKQKRLGRLMPGLVAKYRSAYNATPEALRDVVGNISYRTGDWFVVVITCSWGDLQFTPDTDIPTNSGWVGYERMGAVGGQSPAMELWGFRANGNGTTGWIGVQRDAGDANFTHDFMVFQYRGVDTGSAPKWGMFNTQGGSGNVASPSLTPEPVYNTDVPAGAVFIHLDSNTPTSSPEPVTWHLQGSAASVWTYPWLPFEGFSGNYGWFPYAIYPTLTNNTELAPGQTFGVSLDGPLKWWSMCDWTLRIPLFALFDDEGTGKLSFQQKGMSGKGTVQLNGSGSQEQYPVFIFGPRDRDFSGAGTLATVRPPIVNLNGAGKLVFQNIVPIQANGVNRITEGTLDLEATLVGAAGDRDASGTGIFSPSFLVPGFKQSKPFSGDGALALAVVPRFSVPVNFGTNGNQAQTQDFITAGTTVVLTGVGTLAREGVGAQADTTAPLTGTGQLGLFSTTGSLDVLYGAGEGTLTNPGKPAFSRNRSLSSTGALALAILPKFTDTLELEGNGQLQLAARVGTITTSLQLAGSGQMSLFAGNAASDTEARSGTGTLAVKGKPAIPGARAGAGEGTLTHPGKPIFTGAAFFHSQPVLSFSGTVLRTIFLGGRGGLSRSGRPSFSRAWSGTGAGALTTTRKIALATQLFNSSEGDLELAGKAAIRAALPLSGQGNLTRVILTGTLGILSATGTGQLSRSGAPRFTYGWTASGGGTNALSGSPALAVPRALSGSGQLIVAVSRAGSGTGTLALAGSVGTITAAVNFSGVGGVGRITTVGTSASISFTGAGTQARAGSFGRRLSGTGSLTFSTAWGIRGDILLIGTGQLSMETKLPAPVGTLTINWYAGQLTPRTYAGEMGTRESRTARTRPRPYSGAAFGSHWTGRVK